MLSFRMGHKPQVQLDQASWGSLNPNQREAIQKLVAPVEERGFRYLFEEIVAVGNDLKEREPTTVLGQFARFLSSEPMLELARQITGCEDIAGTDARATRYGPRPFSERP